MYGDEYLGNIFHLISAAKHQTSKLSEFTDLESVITFGFRGEALSSLCAVGDLCIITRNKEQSLGTRLEFDSNGVIVVQKSVPRSVGTSVLFSDIFRNLPVRQKELLKNLKKEYSKMVHMLQSYAMSAHNVRFNVTNSKSGGKTESVFSIKENASKKNVIMEIFGPKQSEAVFEIPSVTISDFVLSGFVSVCQHGKGRSRPDRQYFFVNNRPCDLVKGSKAVNEIYHQYNKHQYPFVMLKICASVKGTVDVNLTPDKRKIFLENEDLIWNALKDSLKAEYDKTAAPETGLERAHQLEPKLAIQNYFPSNFDHNKVAVHSTAKESKEEKTLSKIYEIKANAAKSHINTSSPPLKKKRVTKTVIDHDVVRKDCRKSIQVNFRLDNVKVKENLCPKPNVTKGRNFFTSLTDGKERVENEFKKHLNKSDFETGVVCGQFNLGFIITKFFDSDLFIIDQHAADEKFRFEQFLKETKSKSQPLVCPQDLDLDPGHKELLRANVEKLTLRGFKFSIGDNNTFSLTQVPQCDRLVLGKEEIDEALYLLSEDGNFELEKYQFSRVQTLFASRACRTAVMIGTALKKSQMTAIVRQMSKMDQPWNCPHGRPTLRHLINLQMLTTK